MLVKPPPLLPSDTVGIVAPGSAPIHAETFQQGIRNLRASGLTVKPGNAPYPTRGYLSASDEERLREFHNYMSDPDVKALICARGGYGCLRLLPFINYEMARRHPKFLIGYSDVTALQMALFRHAGLTSLAGPMVAPDWSDPDIPTIENFWRIAGGEFEDNWAGPTGELLVPINQGAVEGTLLGGNLSVITRLIGTPYLPDLSGAILFVEDVDEPPYRIDGMFAQMRNAGLLDEIGGLLIGSFTNENIDGPSLTVQQVVQDYVAPLSIPVATNLMHGHIRSMNTMPIGVRASLQVSRNEAHLTLLESACAEPVTT